VNTHYEALAFLVESGYAVDIGEGWRRIGSCPRLMGPQGPGGFNTPIHRRAHAREVTSFVHAIYVLGTHSVGLHGHPSPVETRTGTLLDEILFRLREEKP